MSKWDDWTDLTTTKTTLHVDDAAEFFQMAGEWGNEIQRELDVLEEMDIDNVFKEVKWRALYNILCTLDDDRAAALQLMVERGPDDE